MKNEFWCYGHIYDFSGFYPVVDDVRLRTREQIKDAIMDLLHSVNYNFEYPRHMPAILSNWRDIQLKELIKFFRKIVSQISSVPSDFPFLDWNLEWYGFCNGPCDPLVTISFEYGGITTQIPISLSLVSYKVGQLLSKVKVGSKYLITIS